MLRAAFFFFGFGRRFAVELVCDFPIAAFLPESS
jgi:hypothetical protein